MKLTEMQERIRQVKIVTIKVNFSKKITNTLDGRDMVRSWMVVGPRETRHFLWPRVTMMGPRGTKTFALTGWIRTPHSAMGPRYMECKPGETIPYIRQMILKAAFGTIVQISANYVDGRGQELAREIEQKINQHASRRDLTKKVETIRRHFRREHARHLLRDRMNEHFADLTDYDVKEAWREVKQIRVVKSVMDS